MPGSTAQPSLATDEARFPFLNFDSQGRVQLDVHVTLGKYLPNLAQELLGVDMDEISIDSTQNMVIGYLPVSKLFNLEQLPHFDSAVPVYKAIVRTGSVESEGDAVIGGPAFRSTYGVTGAGVTVGVMSTSVNQVADPSNPSLVGIAWSQSTGDLPPVVNVLEDDPSAPTDEGRAMLEIVYDVAPGANLDFYTAAIDPQDFANGIRALAAAGATIIVDDIGYLDEPFFNDGVIANAIDDVTAEGVTYVSAAGNQGNHGYLANWSGVSATVAGQPGTYQNISGGSPLQTFSLPVGESIQLSFEWDAAFLEGGVSGSGMGNYAVPNDVAVLITDSAGVNLYAEFDPHASNPDEAFADVAFTNDGSFGTTNFAMSFLLVSGPAPTMMWWISQDDGVTTFDPQALDEGGPTIYGHSADVNTVAVGAVNWQTPTVPESFSSLGGPIPFVFDRYGNRLATPELVDQPNIAGPDGVHTTFFGSPDGSGGFEFYGTSAASPHVAAALALLKQQDPSATSLELVQHIDQTALDIYTPGYDFSTGYGLLQLSPFTNTGGGGSGGATVVSTSDIYSPSNTSDTATNLGALPTGAYEYENILLGTHSGGLPDYDWFRWSPTTSGTFTATITMTQGTNLELHLFTLNGTVLTQLGSTTGDVLSTTVAAGHPIFVEVKGIESPAGVVSTGTYNLTVSLT